MFKVAATVSRVALKLPSLAAIVSPLAPTNGYTGIGVAGVYTKDNMKITLGARYLKVGDADAETRDVARANMTKNDAVAVGMKVGWSF